MKNEGDVKKAVKVLLMSTPKCWWFMPAMNGFGRAGVPDFVGMVNGSMFAIETKFGKYKPTAHQERELAAIATANGQAWVVNEKNFDDWEQEFKEWAGHVSHP